MQEILQITDIRLQLFHIKPTSAIQLILICSIFSVECKDQWRWKWIHVYKDIVELWIEQDVRGVCKLNKLDDWNHSDD